MSNFTITEKNMQKLKNLVAAAIESDEDINDAIDEWKAGLKAAPKGGKKAKKPVDKEMIEAIGKKPPRAKSAYICYGQVNREALKKKNPDATFGDMTKLISEAWNEIKDDKKKSAKYHKMAEDDKKRAAKELAAYEKKLKAYKADGGSGDEASGEDASDEEAPAKPAKGRKAPAKPAKSSAKGKAAKAPAKAKGKKAPVEEESEDEASGDAETKASPEYKKMKLPELKALAKERGVDIKGMKKDDIVAALEAGGDGDAPEEEETVEDAERSAPEDEEEVEEESE